jgi:hypothetical protein
MKLMEEKTPEGNIFATSFDFTDMQKWIPAFA